MAKWIIALFIALAVIIPIVSAELTDDEIRALALTCNNGICDDTETIETCPIDCTNPMNREETDCGNGICDEGENCDNCGIDCGCTNQEGCYQGKCIEQKEWIKKTCTQDPFCFLSESGECLCERGAQPANEKQAVEIEEQKEEKSFFMRIIEWIKGIFGIKESTSEKEPLESEIIMVSQPQGDYAYDDRKPEDVCISMADEVKSSQPMKDCSLLKSERVDAEQDNFDRLGELCPTGGSVAGCFACTFECRQKPLI